jgi:hypothetical protein
LKPMRLPLFLLVGLLTGSPAAQAEDATASGAEASPLDEVRDCIAKNQPDLSAVQTISLKSRDRTGAERESRATVYWQRAGEAGSKVLLRFFSPPDMRGAGLLVLEKPDSRDMFMYLPETGRVRRVTKHMAGGSMFGTDFTYEDFERIHGLAEQGKANRLPDAEVDGRPMYLIEGEPSPEDGRRAERSLTFVDQETCLVRKMEFYERGDRLRRVLSADLSDLIKEAGLSIPREIVAKDLRDGSESSLIVEKIEIDEKLSKKIFSTRWLETGKN